MRVDLYRRPENDGQFSYLVVPEGKEIPQEATNIDWETLEQNVELQRTNEDEIGITLDDAENQFAEKGYAISSVKRLNGQGLSSH
ncbi:MAG: hypothetical protein K0S28_1069 [Paucimonas sp.]|nr:hypothetical protein [Paucimonas sp.]